MLSGRYYLRWRSASTTYPFLRRSSRDIYSIWLDVRRRNFSKRLRWCIVTTLSSTFKYSKEVSIRALVIWVGSSKSQLAAAPKRKRYHELYAERHWNRMACPGDTYSFSLRRLFGKKTRPMSLQRLDGSIWYILEYQRMVQLDLPISSPAVNFGIEYRHMTSSSEMSRRTFWHDTVTR